MYEAANVHLGEYTNESTNQKITCTDEEICHIDGEHEEPYSETIAIDEISAIR